MNKFLMTAVMAPAMLLASQSHAATYAISPVPTAPFRVDAATPTFIQASINGILPNTGAFTDNFTFTLPFTGAGTGSVTSSDSTALFFTDAFLSVYTNSSLTTLIGFFQGNVATNPFGSSASFAAVSASPLPVGAFNVVTVKGVSAGGNYGGVVRASALAAVPEPGTWAMLLAGFGAVGFAMRRRRSATHQVKVSFG